MFLVTEHCAWHQELVNSCQRSPRIYALGNIVFACHAVQSDASKGSVRKLEFSFPGPWQIIDSALSGSYNIEHCHHPNRRMKKHAANLTPYPVELIPFEPVHRPDTEYSQLHKAIKPHPFKAAGINRFLRPKPFQVPAKFLSVFHWPTLSKLNNNIEKFPWCNNKERHQYFADEPPFCPSVMYTRPPPELPSTPQIPEHSAPPISSLAPLIISSTVRLFYILHSIGGNHWEWRLVCIAFKDSIDLYPSCLKDGRFLVDFYMAHPSNVHYNAINQRFWLQYWDRTSTVFGTMDAHLITP
jgi:hypothetical protein